MVDAAGAAAYMGIAWSDPASEEPPVRACQSRDTATHRQARGPRGYDILEQTDVRD